MTRHVFHLENRPSFAYKFYISCFFFVKECLGSCQNLIEEVLHLNIIDTEVDSQTKLSEQSMTPTDLEAVKLS